MTHLKDAELNGIHGGGRASDLEEDPVFSLRKHREDPVDPPGTGAPPGGGGGTPMPPDAPPSGGMS